MTRLIFAGLAVTGFLACGPGGMNGADATPELPSGTEISAATQRSLSSEQDAPGATFTARVANDAKDSTGKVVIPAGAIVHLRVRALEEVSNQEKESAHVGATVTSLTIGEASHTVSGKATSMPYTLEGQGLTTDQVGKTAVGAVAGGVIGRVVGGNKTGTAVGAVAGGAAGAVISKKTSKSDVVVAAGTRIVITLDQSFTAQ